MAVTVNVIEFSKLEKELAKTRRTLLDYLAPKMGRVYVVAITRDGCPACERQKPKLSKLAAFMAEKHGNKVVFTRTHIQYSPGSVKESVRSKEVFGHYFYPTNLILIRTKDQGAIEYYRNAAPSMSELKKNIETALEVATFLEKEAT